MPRRVLVVSGAFPSRAFPNRGVFVKERMRAVGALKGYDLRVVSPTPYFPNLPVFGKWARWAKVPPIETVDGLPVQRPRYLLPPKVGGYFQPRLMLPAIRRAIRRLATEGFEFDLIDAHFVYPNGVVGAMLAEEFGTPLVMTGRGEDILRFPGLPVMGRSIRWAITRCDRFVALSGEIADAMAAQGAPRARIHVIPNGVDCDKFRPFLPQEARRVLGLPCDRPIILSVGNLQERKGFHLLIDALPAIRKKFGDALVVIVGGPAPYGNSFGPEIKRRIAVNGLQDHVLMAGPKSHADLCQWYSAADLCVLLSSREGSPNVVLESLACGVPVVATSVGSIPEDLADSRLGMVLPERSAEVAAEGITQALSHNWDRGAIRRLMEQRSWQHVAVRVASVFDLAICSDGSA
jgi:teichuronic acid biosynthesis glycosyltransferase TuaC